MGRGDSCHPLTGRFPALYAGAESSYDKCMKRYALIGDVHSQIGPLEKALDFCKVRGLTPVLLGDLFDSRMETSNSVEVYRLARESVEKMDAVILRSNHQNKFERYARGAKVRVEGEFSRTLSDFSEARIPVEEVAEWLNTFPYGIVFRDSAGKEYRCSHAMFPSWIVVPGYDQIHKVMEVTSKARDYMLYGPRVAGAVWPKEETRVFWWEKDSERDWVRVAGHYHKVFISDKSIVLDGQMGGTLDPDFDSSQARLCLWDVNNKKLSTFT